MTSWGQIIHLFAKLEELTERCEEYRSHVVMVRRRMMFHPVVGKVHGAGAPIKSELLLAALVRFGCTRLLMMPLAVELST